jgi:hypothetical protein
LYDVDVISFVGEEFISSVVVSGAGNVNPTVVVMFDINADVRSAVVSVVSVVDVEIENSVGVSTPCDVDVFSVVDSAVDSVVDDVVSVFTEGFAKKR